MLTVATLWIPFTIIAALGQVARNAMQRSLTGPLGTWGATNIRFLFGFPFSIIFFAVVVTVTGDRIPWPTTAFWPWLLLGALSQIAVAKTKIAAPRPTMSVRSLHRGCRDVPLSRSTIANLRRLCPEVVGKS